MDEEWDTDNFKIKEPVAVSANKWEGEDEDDDVKDSWDAEEEEEKKDVEKTEAKSKTKKSLAEKIAEREKIKEEESKKAEQEEEEEELSAEERLRREQNSDLLLALDTTFSEKGGTSIDGMQPKTKEEFSQFADALNRKILPYMKSPEFVGFAEEHFRNICASLSSADIKKLKTTLDNMFIEKQKAEKGEKTKKNKGKGKAKLRIEGDNTLDEYTAYAGYDDYDDFM